MVSGRAAGAPSPFRVGTSGPGTTCYLVAARELVLMDNVRISKPTQKEELRTDLLHYYDATKMAVCPGDVEILTLTIPSIALELLTN